MSGSFAYLRSPEALRPDESVHRVASSVAYAAALPGGGALAATAVYGANRRSGALSSDPSYLMEANLDFDKRHSLFGRAECVRKEASDLSVPGVPGGLVNVSEMTLGYVYDLNRSGPTRLGVGVRGTVNFVPPSLEDAYGSRRPTGLAIYLRLRPALMPMTSHDHEMMKGMSMPPTPHR